MRTGGGGGVGVGGGASEEEDVNQVAYDVSSDSPYL